MDTDKNLNLLEKQLKTLGQKVRIDILKRLNNNQTPLSFSRLQKDILGHNASSVNLSFHLNSLKKSELIFSSEEGYLITSLGQQILDKILSIEQILNNQNKARVIRTSKYSKELFDINKIEEYLVVEGELDHYLARQIAHEVEERLSKTNIEYMTAPLMREYINAILLENGLEEVRHKLTRLGTPPFEVFKLFNSNIAEINPKIFIEKVGSDVSEQFLLLNLLPKNLADLYLSGEIALLHLNYWALRPLSLYINTNTLIDFIKKETTFGNEIFKTENNSELLIQFLDLLYVLKQFYSEDLLLGNFNTHFISYFSHPNAMSLLFPIFSSQILRFNNFFNGIKPSLTLDFNYNRDSMEGTSNQYHIDNNFLNSLNKQCKNRLKPLLLFESSSLFASGSTLAKNLIMDNIKKDVILYNKNYTNLINSTIIQIPSPQDNNVILDKILINLHLISIESRQNDNKFFDSLIDKLTSIFELFDYKKKLVKKKLNSLRQWKFMVSKIFNTNTIFKNSLKSISFFGFNEAILNHCGIELDRTKSSEYFALKVLSLMKKIIKERNEVDGNNFILSQPHCDSYLYNSYHNGLVKSNQKIKGYTSDLIRRESNLPLNKKIVLFKKFQNILDGGSIFVENINTDKISPLKFLKMINESKIGAISLKNCIS